ncbi:Similarity (Modular protein) [Planktothrix tepida]|uniref:Similarity (Modular protein) n=1 Tax=Planktothrix tepida PCC 9214 TaxID=671072 RepID=A0A1J1LU36_9CYAN|nr:hypothetical protein [Planktothrix tepida]CAD5978652.1 Similarity (Modular protein) [Planktothrix tepida]CUR36112.1 Similarity (modular protein) [Planktothrix tepida PCC 9214]
MDSPTQRNMIITYTKVNQKQQKNDFTYWQKQPYLERLAALEQIRQDYHQWKYHAEPRLQRIYRIIKQK